MNTAAMIRSLCKYLDNIVLRPKLTVSLSTYNRNTGAFSEQKSIRLSAGFTLLRGTMMLAGFTAAACSMAAFLRWKERKKLCREMKCGKKHREKMAKP